MGWLCFSFVFFFPRCLNSSHFQKNNFGKGFFWEWFGVFFQVLKVFPFPITITNLQFAVGGVIVLLMWVTGLHKKPSSISRNQVCTQKPSSQQTRTTKEQAALNSSAGTRSGCSRVFCKKSVQQVLQEVDVVDSAKSECSKFCSNYQRRFFNSIHPLLLPITKDSFNSILQMRLFWVPRCLMD